MATYNIFSKRQKKNRGEVPEVFTYDNLPKILRVQIYHIVKDAIGEKKSYSVDKAYEVYETIVDILCKEYGILTLNGRYDEIPKDQVLNFILNTNKTEEFLDVIEIAFKLIDGFIKKYYQDYTNATAIKIQPDEAIEDLNDRFKEHGIGYQFESGEIIRLDSTYIHSQIVKPALTLLWNPKFEGANEEYLKAHEHYRHGRNKECLVDCLKSFESTMKVICKEKGWAFNPTDPAKKLINICFQNELIPAFTQNQFSSLQNLLESGIPTIRNKLGGHGQGQMLQKVDDEMARYGLNLTGTNIIFLIEHSSL